MKRNWEQLRRVSVQASADCLWVILHEILLPRQVAALTEKRPSPGQPERREAVTAALMPLSSISTKCRENLQFILLA